jgi:serine/threonine-protein kinase
MSEGDREAEARLGEVLDRRYRLVKVLGTGGMGTVYEAEHVVLKRPRAVKILHPSLTTTRGMAQRFEREAIAAGKLRDPHCIEISDFGKVADGTLYLVMELVRGPTLRGLLEAEGRISVARAIHVLRQTLKALEHAHALEIVHRDIKPENIMLVERGGDRDFVKLLDFGIAKLIGAEAEGQEQLTATGFAVGTPRYLAPEQALGVPLDGRLDLYSATVVFYELVAGRTPFVGEGVQLVTQHLTKPPPPLSEVAPDQGVTPALDALVLRGLAKDREARFPSAGAYRAALDECARAAPTPGAAAPELAVVAQVPVRAPEAFGQTAMAATPVPALAPESLTRALRPPQSGAAPARQGAGRRRALKIIVGAAALLLAIGIASEAVGPSRGERVNQALQELKRGASCNERREAVRKLRALGDPRAIPELERARRRMRGGVVGIGQKNSNACLEDDAGEAIDHLQRRGG